MTLAVSNLGKRFNREWIFRGLTTEFQADSVYAITGPNGSGKSTLMQILWGQAPPSEGLLEFKEGNRRIAVEEIFQHLTIAAPYMDLIEDFTLREQAAFHFRFKNLEADSNLDSFLEKLELTSAANKPIKQFSSGMKQRVKLGLALFSSSKVIFLDEPTTNLDEAATAWYIQHLSKAMAGKVVFIATNQPNDYPKTATIINMADLKGVTKRHSTGM